MICQLPRGSTHGFTKMTKKHFFNAVGHLLKLCLGRAGGLVLAEGNKGSPAVLKSG